MKKNIIAGLMVWVLVCGVSSGMDISLEVKTNWLIPAEEVFRDIYGSGLAFGGAAILEVSPSWEISLEGSWFSRDGELTHTVELTELSLFALGMDVKYLFPLEWVTLYGAPGVYIHWFNESNRLGEGKKSGLGFKLKAGGLVPLSKDFKVNVFAGYSFCTMTPVDLEITIGGFEAGLGLRYTFPLSE